jgi:uncharacterized damage-inducible protein DinB
MTKPLFDIAPLPGYPDPYGILLATLQEGTRDWKQELGEPDRKLIGWQPFPNGHSIGAVLLHIASVEVFWIEEFCLRRTTSPEEAKRLMTEETDQYKVSWPTPPDEPISYYHNLLDQVRARTLESVKSFPVADTRIESDYELTTLRWVLAHIIAHESYHAGQAVLLRELGSRLTP